MGEPKVVSIHNEDTVRGRGVPVDIHKDRLNVDDGEGGYQRGNRSKSKIKQIADNFCWRLFGRLLVSERPDGTLWVIDGGHRVAAAKMLASVDLVPCEVFKTSGQKEEARIFYLAQKMRSAMKSYDGFRAGLLAGHRDACVADAIMRRYSYRPAKAGDKGDGTFHGLGNLISVAGRSEECADRAFKAAAAMAEGSMIRGRLYDGLAALCERLGPNVLDQKTIEKLAFLGQEACWKILYREAKADRGGRIVYAKTLLRIINDGRRRKIRWPR